VSEQNKEIALRFVKAMSTNDPEGAAATLAPDAITNTKGYSKFAARRPASAVVAAIESFKGLFPNGLGLTIHTVVAEGDKVVIEGDGHAVMADGNPYENQYCFVITLRDGKIVEINEYLCSALAEKVLLPVVEKLGNVEVIGS